MSRGIAASYRPPMHLNTLSANVAWQRDYGVCGMRPASGQPTIPSGSPEGDRRPLGQVDVERVASIPLRRLASSLAGDDRPDDLNARLVEAVRGRSVAAADPANGPCRRRGRGEEQWQDDDDAVVAAGAAAV